jgi:hypothetical protein
VAAQHLPDSVGRDGQPAPLRASELCGDAPGPHPRMSEREPNDALLDERRELVGHHRSPPLARTQHLKAVAIDLGLPTVIGRSMHPERPTGVRNRRAVRQIKQRQAIAEKHVILRHATPSELHWREARSLSRNTDSLRPAGRRLSHQDQLSISRSCRENMESVQPLSRSAPSRPVDDRFSRRRIRGSYGPGLRNYTQWGYVSLWV